MPKHNKEEKRYCPLCQKREGRSECSYGERVWDKVSVKDEEYSMARSEIENMQNAINILKTKVGKGEGNLEAWVQSKITKAADYIDTAADYLNSKESSFDESKSFTVDPEQHKKKQKAAKIYNLTRNNPNPHEVAAAKSRSGPSLPAVKKEEKMVDKIINDLKEEDPCWKGYTQVGMKNKNGKEVPNCVPVKKGVKKAKGYKKESLTIDDLNGKPFIEIEDLILPEPIKEATRLQAETGNIISVLLSWRGKYHTITMFFPQVKLPSRKDINYELQKVYPDSRVISYSVSNLDPSKPLIRVGGGDYGRPGPSKNYVKPMGEDWQKVNRNDKTDGLSQKAVNAYRKENPGSKLQTAVTEKNPTGKRSERRKSFCRRMSGMKSKLTSAKTSRDPDSRINKALRRWNCN